LGFLGLRAICPVVVSAQRKSEQRVAGSSRCFRIRWQGLSLVVAG